MFDSLIHKRQELQPIEKYHYPKLSLEGEAAQVINSLEFTASAYDSAWDLLCNRYNNERLLVDNHVNALFNMESIQVESSVKIRNLMDTVAKHLRALKSLNQPTDTWDTLIIHIVKTKLDAVTVREWEEYKINIEIPNLEALKQFLTGMQKNHQAYNLNCQHLRESKKSDR
jgi:hypothetical protein